MTNSPVFTGQERDSALLHFVTKKKWAWVRHFFLILIITVNFELLDIEGVALYAKKVNVTLNAFYTMNSIMAVLALGLVYINLYILFPFFFRKQKYVSYALSVLIMLFLFFLSTYTLQQILVTHFNKNKQYAIDFGLMSFIQTVMYPLVFLASTTGYRVFKTSIVDQKRFAALEKEKLNTELTQLKNQVNPHFLFNTLNNLHVLTKTNPDKASQIILGLSDVLRYQIYDSRHDRVSLTRDIEIIQEYIDLEKIRRNHLSTSVTIEGNTNGAFIPPLLFINFIDNAIKHSATSGEAFIHVLFRVTGNELYFEVVNSKPAHQLRAENGRVGLPNIIKRLELLYGPAHTLELFDEVKQYTVKLKFPL
jgi:sensor histidine kinase YesM